MVSLNKIPILLEGRGNKKLNYKKEYYLNNKDRINQYSKEYYLNNIDKIKERKINYYLKNKDMRKEYLIKNKNKIKEQKKEYNRKYYLNFTIEKRRIKKLGEL